MWRVSGGGGKYFGHQGCKLKLQCVHLPTSYSLKGKDNTGIAQYKQRL